MLFKQEQRKNTRDTFATCTNCQFALLVIIETTRCILIAFEVEDRRFQEAIETDVGWMYIMDDQLWWITDGGFRSTYLKTNAHAILLFEAFKSIHLRDWTCANLFNEFFSFGFNFTEINLIISLIKLLLQSLIHRLVFKSTLIKTLLKTCLTDCSVCNIVELSKHSIVNEIMLIFFHEVEDNRDLPFVSHVLLH